MNNKIGLDSVGIADDRVRAKSYLPVDRRISVFLTKDCSVRMPLSNDRQAGIRFSSMKAALMPRWTRRKRYGLRLLLLFSGHVDGD